MFGGGISALITDHGQGILRVVNCTFEDNSGELGMAIYSFIDLFTGSDCKLSFENTDFKNHTIISYSEQLNPSVILAHAIKHVDFINCEFKNNVVTAIFAMSSHLFFEGKYHSGTIQERMEVPFHYVQIPSSSLFQTHMSTFTTTMPEMLVVLSMSNKSVPHLELTASFNLFCLSVLYCHFFQLQILVSILITILLEGLEMLFMEVVLMSVH